MVLAKVTKITGFMATSNGHHKATACQYFTMRFHMELAPPEISHFCITVVLLQVFRPSAELRSWQAHMASLLRQQREKGGVIDPSREDDTIDETWVRPEGVPEDGTRQKFSGAETSFIRCRKAVRGSLYKKDAASRPSNTKAISKLDFAGFVP